MYFHFKQFAVRHGKSAFKVGFDGILLGAWCNFRANQRILDIGTGCGLLALIAAQKNSECRIDAIEPDPDSYEEAVYNFSNSPWKDRLLALNCTSQEFAIISTQKYDHIVSNPPFFFDSLLPEKDDKIISKHTQTLNHDQLIENSYSLMRENAMISIILPPTEGDKLIQKSKTQGLQLSRLTKVISKRKHVRHLIELMKCESCTPEINELQVYSPAGGYSDSYIALVKDLYLAL